MFQQLMRIRITIVCLIGLPLGPGTLQAAEGGLRGGGRSGGATPGAGSHVHPSPGPTPTPHAVHTVSPTVVHSGPSATTVHSGAAPLVIHGGSAPVVHSNPTMHGPALHGAVGIHGTSPVVHGPVVGLNHVGYVGHGPVYAANLHAPGPHWNTYHQAYIGSHPMHLAWSGYRPSYYYHNWYHGPWGGHNWGWGWGYGPGLSFGIGGIGVGAGSGWGYPAYYGPYGRYGYWGRPLGWGFGGWGLGSWVYSSGYYPYYNPYYAVGSYPVVVYNYARPIPVAVQAPASPVSGAPTLLNDPSTDPGNPAFDAARQAFTQGDYMTALSNVDSALAKSQSDAVMHEFRSLVLFALGDYRQSAAVIHSVLAVGPGWDWTTMSGLYPDPQIYSDQLRRLEQYANGHPQAADAHFLLAYHDMIGNRKDDAAAELQQVVRLMPTDRLAGELLTMVKGPASPPQSNRPPVDPNDPANDQLPVNLPAPAPEASNDTAPIDQSLLPGTWNASRDDGSKFRLTMTNDGKFTWKYSSPNQKGDEFSGTYSVDGAVLALERKEGGALAATATFMNDRSMNFKMVGGPPEDKGLDFAK